MNTRRTAALFLLVWMAAVLLALASTLRSLDDDFDGLNNLLQLPLALPRSLLVPSSSDHATQAWVDAGWGTLNGVVLAALVFGLATRGVRSAKRAR